MGKVNKIYNAIAIIIIIFSLILFYCSSKHSGYILYNPVFHYYYVFLSSIISLIVGIVAYKDFEENKEVRVYLVSLGFIGVSVIYGFHGFVTPGKSLFSFPDLKTHINAFVFFGDFSRLWIALMLFSPRLLIKENNIKIYNLGNINFITLLLIIFSLWGLNNPEVFPTIKEVSGKDTHFTILFKVITLILLGVSFTKFYDSHRILNNIPILTLIVGTALIMETSVMFLISKPWGLTWWLAHNIYLLSFIIIGLGLWISRKGYKYQYFDVAKQVENYIFTIKRNKEELEQLNKKLSFMANTDALTQLPNRNYFNQYLEKYIEDAIKESIIFAILFIDLDGFKKVNDVYGHEVGDEVLKSSAKKIRGVLRETDIISRFGGDEFVVLLYNTSKSDTARISEKIIESFKEPIKINSCECTVGTSIGISLFPDDGIDKETLIKRSDEAMYLVKSKGKNNYKFYS